MGGFAWVTLATNDSYSLGALVLAHSLRNAKTIHQLAVLITPAVSTPMREQLATAYDLVQVVDVLDSKDEANLALLKRPELGITFTKIHCWRLTQFEKCVFLDADTLVVRNCDELFEREEFSAAPDVGWPDCFNSGVFVFKPSIETFSKLIQFAVEKGSFDGGDQGLLNQFFSSWATDDIKKHLPFVYNLTSVAVYSYIPAFKQYGSETRIVHFIGPLKPWLQPVDPQTRTVNPSSDSAHLQPLLQQWWDLFCEKVHPGLSANLDFSGMLPSRAPTTSSPDPPIDTCTLYDSQSASSPSFPEPYTPYIENDDARQINLPYQPFQVVSSEGELLNITFADVARDIVSENNIDIQDIPNIDKNDEYHVDAVSEQLQHEDKRQEEPQENDGKEEQAESIEPSPEPFNSEQEQYKEKSQFDYHSFFPDEECINAYLDYNVKEYQPFLDSELPHEGNETCYLDPPALPRFLTIPEDDPRQSGKEPISEPWQPPPPVENSYQNQNGEKPWEQIQFHSQTLPPSTEPAVPEPARSPSPHVGGIEPTAETQSQQLTRSKSMSVLMFDVSNTDSFPSVSPWKSKPEINEVETPKKEFLLPALKPLLPKTKSSPLITVPPKYTEFTEVHLASDYSDPFGPPADQIGFVERELMNNMRGPRNKFSIPQGVLNQPKLPTPTVVPSVTDVPVFSSFIVDEDLDLSQCKRQSGNKPNTVTSKTNNDSTSLLATPAEKRQRRSKKIPKRVTEKWKPPEEENRSHDVADILKRLSELSVNATPAPAFYNPRTNQRPRKETKIGKENTFWMAQKDKQSTQKSTCIGSPEKTYMKNVQPEIKTISSLQYQTETSLNQGSDTDKDVVAVNPEIVIIAATPISILNDPFQTVPLEKTDLDLQTSSVTNQTIKSSAICNVNPLKAQALSIGAADDLLSQLEKDVLEENLIPPSTNSELVPDKDLTEHLLKGSESNAEDNLKIEELLLENNTLKLPTELKPQEVLKKMQKPKQSSTNGITSSEVLVKSKQLSANFDTDFVRRTEEPANLDDTEAVLENIDDFRPDLSTVHSITDFRNVSLDLTESSKITNVKDTVLQKVSEGDPMEIKTPIEKSVEYNGKTETVTHLVPSVEEEFTFKNFVNSQFDNPAMFNAPSNDSNKTACIEELIIEKNLEDILTLPNKSVEEAKKEITENVTPIFALEALESGNTVESKQLLSEPLLEIPEIKVVVGQNEECFVANVNDNLLKPSYSFSDLASKCSNYDETELAESAIGYWDENRDLSSAAESAFSACSHETLLQDISESDIAASKSHVTNVSLSPSSVHSATFNLTKDVPSRTLPTENSIASETYLKHLGIEEVCQSNVTLVPSSSNKAVSYAEVAKISGNSVSTEKKQESALPSVIQKRIRKPQDVTNKPKRKLPKPTETSTPTQAPKRPATSPLAKLPKKKTDRPKNGDSDLLVNRFELLPPEEVEPSTTSKNSTKKKQKKRSSQIYFPPVPPSPDSLIPIENTETPVHYIPEPNDNSGLAGAIAQLDLEARSDPTSAASTAAQAEYLRRQSWETGNIDYLGRDSFANIWAKISETLSKGDNAPAPCDQVAGERPVSLSMILDPPDSDSIETLPSDITFSPGEEAEDDIIFERIVESSCGLSSVLEKIEEVEETMDLTPKSDELALVVSEKIEARVEESDSLSEVTEKLLIDGEGVDFGSALLSSCENKISELTELARKKLLSQSSDVSQQAPLPLDAVIDELAANERNPLSSPIGEYVTSFLDSAVKSETNLDDPGSNIDSSIYLTKNLPKLEDLTKSVSDEKSLQEASQIKTTLQEEVFDEQNPVLRDIATVIISDIFSKDISKELILSEATGTTLRSDVKELSPTPIKQATEELIISEAIQSNQDELGGEEHVDQDGKEKLDKVDDGIEAFSSSKKATSSFQEDKVENTDNVSNSSTPPSDEDVGVVLSGTLTLGDSTIKFASPADDPIMSTSAQLPNNDDPLPLVTDSQQAEISSLEKTDQRKLPSTSDMELSIHDQIITIPELPADIKEILPLLEDNLSNVEAAIRDIKPLPEVSDLCEVSPNLDQNQALTENKSQSDESATIKEIKDQITNDINELSKLLDSTILEQDQIPATREDLNSNIEFAAGAESLKEIIEETEKQLSSIKEVIEIGKNVITKTLEDVVLPSELSVSSIPPIADSSFETDNLSKNSESSLPVEPEVLETEKQLTDLLMGGVTSVADVIAAISSVNEIDELAKLSEALTSLEDLRSEDPKSIISFEETVLEAPEVTDIIHASVEEANILPKILEISSFISNDDEAEIQSSLKVDDVIEEFNVLKDIEESIPAEIPSDVEEIKSNQEKQLPVDFELTTDEIISKQANADLQTLQEDSILDQDDLLSQGTQLISSTVENIDKLFKDLEELSEAASDLVGDILGAHKSAEPSPETDILPSTVNNEKDLEVAVDTAISEKPSELLEESTINVLETGANKIEKEKNVVVESFENQESIINEGLIDVDNLDIITSSTDKVIVEPDTLRNALETHDEKSIVNVGKGSENLSSEKYVSSDESTEIIDSNINKEDAQWVSQTDTSVIDKSEIDREVNLEEASTLVENAFDRNVVEENIETSSDSKGNISQEIIQSPNLDEEQSRFKSDNVIDNEHLAGNLDERGEKFENKTNLEENASLIESPNADAKFNEVIDASLTDQAVTDDKLDSEPAVTPLESTHSTDLNENVNNESEQSNIDQESTVSKAISSESQEIIQKEATPPPSAISVGADSGSAFVPYTCRSRESEVPKVVSPTRRRQSANGKEKKGVVTKFLEFVGVVKKKEEPESSSVFYDDEPDIAPETSNKRQVEQTIPTPSPLSLQPIPDPLITLPTPPVSGQSQHIFGDSNEKSVKESINEKKTATSSEEDAINSASPQGLIVENVIPDTPPVIKNESPILEATEGTQVIQASVSNDNLSIPPDEQDFFDTLTDIPSERTPSMSPFEVSVHKLSTSTELVNESADVPIGTSSLQVEVEPEAKHSDPIAAVKENFEEPKPSTDPSVLGTTTDSANLSDSNKTEVVAENNLEKASERLSCQRQSPITIEKPPNAPLASGKISPVKPDRVTFALDENGSTINRSKIKSDIDSIMAQAKLIAEDRKTSEPIYSNVTKKPKIIAVEPPPPPPPINPLQEFEEIKVTSDEDRKKSATTPKTSKLSQQILKAIPPPRRRAISDSKKIEDSKSANVEVVIKKALDIVEQRPTPSPTQRTSSSAGSSDAGSTASVPPVPPRRNRSKQRSTNFTTETADTPQPPPKRKPKK